VCTENLVRFDDVMESPELAGPGKKKEKSRHRVEVR
jgi:hypothetical protein